MRDYVCILCKDVGNLRSLFGFVRKCPRCEERKKQEEKIFAEKLACIGPPIYTTVKPRLKLDKQQWICMSNVLQGGVCIGILVTVADTAFVAYGKWDYKRQELKARIQ